MTNDAYNRPETSLSVPSRPGPCRITASLEIQSGMQTIRHCWPAPEMLKRGDEGSDAAGISGYGALNPVNTLVYLIANNVFLYLDLA